MAGYSALLGLGLLVSSPWWLLRMATTGRYREGLRERLGAVPARLRAAVAGRRVVWVHAVSVGEVLAVSRLVTELGTALNAAGCEAANFGEDNLGTDKAATAAWTIVISTTTRTGQALARERFGAERVFFFPLDLRWAVRAYLHALRPALLVLAESELWPRVLHECERNGVPVAVVNARVSDRSFRRALRLKPVWGRMLRTVPLWLAQSDEDARRLLALGARAASVQVSGNLKFDVRVPRGSRVANLIRRLAGDRMVVVAGSTVDRLAGDGLSEEEIVMQAWEGAPRRELRSLLILAPRHPERFETVYTIAMKFPTLRATEMLASNAPGDLARSSSEPPSQSETTDCVVLDTLGDLAAVYGVADVAVVGGSLLPRGGHNPLEPAQWGVPVLMGPSFENFRDVVGKLQSARGIAIVSNGEELAERLLWLLRAPEEARAMGERGQQVFEREGGATGRTVAALLPMVQTSICAPPEAVPA